MSRNDEDQKKNHSNYISTHLSYCLSRLTLAIVREEKNHDNLIKLKSLFCSQPRILDKYNIEILTLDYSQGYTGLLKKFFIKIFSENAQVNFTLFQRAFPDGVRIIYFPKKGMKTIPYEFAGQMILLSIYLSAKQFIQDEFKESLTSPKIKKAYSELDEDWNKTNKILMGLYDLPIGDEKIHESKINKLDAVIQDFYNHIRVRLLPLIMNGRATPQSRDIQGITEIIKLCERNIKINVDKKLEKELYRDIFILDSENYFQLIETHFFPTKSQVIPKEDPCLLLQRSPHPYNLFCEYLPNFKLITHGIYKESFAGVASTHFNFGSPVPKNSNSNEHEINYQTFLNFEQIMQNIRCKKIQALLLAQEKHLTFDKVLDYSLKISATLTKRIQNYLFHEHPKTINHIKILKEAVNENKIAAPEISILYSTTQTFFFPKFFYINTPALENKHADPISKKTLKAFHIAQCALGDLHFSSIPFLTGKKHHDSNLESFWQNFMIEIFLRLKECKMEYGYLHKIAINPEYFAYRSRLIQAARIYLAAQKQKSLKPKLDNLLNQFEKIEDVFLSKINSWFCAFIDELGLITEKISHSEVKLFKFLLAFNDISKQKLILPGVIPAVTIILLQNLDPPLQNIHMTGGGSLSGGGDWQIVESFLEYFKQADLVKLLDANELSSYELPSKLQFFLQNPYYEPLSPALIKTGQHLNSLSKLGCQWRDEDKKKVTHTRIVDLFKQLNMSSARPSYFPPKNLTEKKPATEAPISNMTSAVWPKYIKIPERLNFLGNMLDGYITGKKSRAETIAIKDQILCQIAIIRSFTTPLEKQEELALAWLEFTLKSQPQTDPALLKEKTQLKLQQYLMLIKRLFRPLPPSMSFLIKADSKSADPLPLFWKLIEYILNDRAKFIESEIGPSNSFFFNNPREGIYISVISILSTQSQYTESALIAQIAKLKSYLLLPEFFAELMRYRNLDLLLCRYTNNRRLGNSLSVREEDIHREIFALLPPAISADAPALENLQAEIFKLQSLCKLPDALGREQKTTKLKGRVLLPPANTSNKKLNDRSDLINKHKHLIMTWLELFLKRIPEPKFELAFQDKRVQEQFTQYLRIIRILLSFFPDFEKAMADIKPTYMVFLDLTDQIFKLRKLSLTNKKDSFFHDPRYERIYHSIINIWKADPQNLYATLISQVRHLNAYLTSLEDKHPFSAQPFIIS